MLLAQIEKALSIPNIKCCGWNIYYWTLTGDAKKVKKCDRFLRSTVGIGQKVGDEIRSPKQILWVCHLYPFIPLSSVTARIIWDRSSFLN